MIRVGTTIKVSGDNLMRGHPLVSKICDQGTFSRATTNFAILMGGVLKDVKSGVNWWAGVKNMESGQYEVKILEIVENKLKCGNQGWGGRYFP